MNLKHFITLLALSLSLSACWVGDRDDLPLVYDNTLIEVLCQTPDCQIFCELAFRTPTYQSGASEGAPIVGFTLGTSGFGDVDPNTGERCASQVETVFAPTDSAFIAWLEFFPQWDTYLDIPPDSVFLVLRHHIYRGDKLFIEKDNLVCREREITIGSGANATNMWFGTWAFAQNADGDIAPLSEQTNRFASPIFSPDISTTDGALYVIDRVLGPF